MNNRIGNFRMFCWIDNSVVKFFSNLHLGSSDEKGLKGRKRPKLNGFNNKNVRLVWDEEFRVDVEIMYQQLSINTIIGCLV